MPIEPKIERRREILYGTPGTVLYRDGKPVLWIPDDFGSLTRNLSYKDLESLLKELRVRETLIITLPTPIGHCYAYVRWELSPSLNLLRPGVRII